MISMLRTRKLGHLVGAAAAALVLTTSCGGGSSSNSVTTPNPTPTGSTSNSLTVSNNLFDPNSTTVPVGTTVTWTWAVGSVNHNVTFDDGTKSGTQNTGTFTRTFTTAGTYNYHCTIHGSAMSGTIKVQ
jgi:plastocyanin